MSNRFLFKDAYVLKGFFFFLGCLITTLTMFFFLSKYDFPVEAANVLSNPSFTGGTTSWTLTNMTYDSSTYQDSAGSVNAYAGRKASTSGTAVHNSYTSIASDDTVTLSGYWYDTVGGNGSGTASIEIEEQSSAGTWIEIWSSGLQTVSGSWTQINTDVSSYFGTGSYRIRLRAELDGGAAASSEINIWFDNLNLDVVSPQPTITVGTTGTQISSVASSTSNFYVGGAFTFIRDETSTSVTSITVSETGTISDANISGLILYYKQEATCSTSIPVDATQFNSTAGTFTSGSSTVTGTMTVGTSQVCVYTEVDIGAASNGDTIEIQITNPSTQVTASAGNVSPSTAVAISGTTTVAVNQAPSFTAFSNDGPTDPGASITFTATSTDPDGNNVKLVVCKTAGITGTECDGGATDTWCTSSLVASNPSCAYSIPTPTPDTTYNVYPYVFDSNNLGSTDTAQGTLSTYTVNNVAPVVSGVTLNGGAAIDLTAGGTKAVDITGTVTDNNSCEDTTSVIAYAYRSGIGYTGCDTVGKANDNYCYPDITCTVDTGTCTGSTDASATYTCTANLQYFADPTDTNTQFPTETWKSTIKATDDNTLSGHTEVSTGVELNSLMGFNITTEVNYGALGIGESNDPLDRTTHITPTGNIGLDHEVSGPSHMCTDFPTCSGSTIAIEHQKYALSSSTAYTSATALSTLATQVATNVSKPTTTTPIGKSIWWGMLVPEGTNNGSYDGTITITGLKSAIENW